MTEHEELLMLRALAAKQAQELEASKRIIAERDEKIRKQNIQIDNMIQALLHARKKLFGPSTEVTQTDGQLSLFESVQELAERLNLSKEKITVKPYTRTARKPGVRKEMLAGFLQEVEKYVLPAEEKCSVCGGEMKVTGKKVVRTEVEFQPAKLIVKQIIQQVAKCVNCGTEDSPNEKCHFQKAAVPVPPLAYSISTPSLIAQVMYQKFALGLPLSRQEKDWYRLGLVLSRSNMANWVIRCSEEWFKPVYWRIYEKLLECDLIHMDETRIRCNKEEGKLPSSESFMWVMRSAASEDIQAAFFFYSRSRGGENARKLLKDFNGYLITDAYAGYDTVPDIKRALCWSHARRYLIESIPLDSQGKEIPGSKGAEGREYINLLFKVEEEIKNLPYEEKKQKRQDASKPILDAFWTWVEKTSAMYTTNEKLTQALGYCQNQRKYLETFLEDGRIPLSNNYCEANIKPFATARRAWLFADTPKGAFANGVLYTLVESAKANDLDVYEYLKHLLTERPNNHHLEKPSVIDRLLPWSKELPEQCRMKRNRKKFLKQ
ncbi:IS66 family transposase [Ruminococcus sp. Marseille-P328]|uniref:IS66 family transposase n=1 Tax=Ruminococcus sp. Marseille-P328 TaxID=1816688 RepID=UPI0035627F88